MTSQHDLDRRDFVKIVLTFLGAIMGAILGLPVIGYLISPALKVRKSEDWISVGPLENYPVGSPSLFSFTRAVKNGWERTANSYGVYVVRSQDGQAKVFSNMCTHLSCRVTWNEAAQQYVCPCHDGRFDLQGKVCAGPPPAALNQYETKVEADSLYIYFKEGGHA